MDIENYRVENLDLFPLILSKRFTRILKDIDDDISSELLKLFSEQRQFKETYIDRTDKEDIVSFLSSDKVNKMIEEGGADVEFDCWSSPQRIEIKIGRLIYRLLGDKILPVDLENFVNEYKSIITAKKLNRNFKIIEGNELKKWYLENNYVEGGGNLKDSCMRYKFSQAFLELYTHNPEKIKLLILLDEDYQKILGRALLWKLDRPEDRYFMDRVYFSEDFILNMFINHAIKNKWYYKLESADGIFQVVYNNKVSKITMVVKLKKEDYQFYPFVDNICFYDPNSATLTNDPRYLKSIGCVKYYDLDDAAGGYTIREYVDFSPREILEF